VIDNSADVHTNESLESSGKGCAKRKCRQAMERMTNKLTLGEVELVNPFIFPPIKTGHGNAWGTVTTRHEPFYRTISRNGRDW
jgi:hypothetical protein